MWSCHISHALLSYLLYVLDQGQIRFSDNRNYYLKCICKDRSNKGPNSRTNRRIHPLGLFTIFFGALKILNSYICRDKNLRNFLHISYLYTETDPSLLDIKTCYGMPHIHSAYKCSVAERGFDQVCSQGLRTNNTTISFQKSTKF